MTDDERTTFYTREYRQVYQGNESPIQKDISIQSARAEALLVFFSKRAQVVSRHLDIGCSTGLLLKCFQARYRNQIVGVEPGDAYRNHVSGQGIIVYETLEALLNAGEALFDLITIMHVLEHLPNPVSYLAEIRDRLLAPGGWLMVEVPNLYAHDCFETAHLVSFSAHTLQQTLEKAGFRIVASQKHGIPRSKLLPLYITVIGQLEKNPGRSDVIKPEKGVATKRSLGLARNRILMRLFPQKSWLPIS